MYHFIFKASIIKKFNKYVFDDYSVPNIVWGTRKPKMNKNTAMITPLPPNRQQLLASTMCWAF